MFTDYVWAFQLTGLLLTVAVVGAVVLARRGDSDGDDAGEPAAPGGPAEPAAGSAPGAV